MKKLAILAALVVVVIGVMISTSKPALAHHYVVSGASIPYSLSDLKTYAEIVAVVRPTGHDSVHWNNGSNSRWESDGLARIYNDQQVVVVDLISGNAGKTLTIRNVGGIVGDTWYEVEGLEPLAKGSEYLVFLKSFDTPTQEGNETAISFLGRDQGIFTSINGSYVNSHGLMLKESDLAR